jgi:transposase
MVATIGVRQGPRPVDVWFVDASHLPHEPDVQRGWGRKGHQIKVPTPTRRQSATLFGALPVRTQRFDGKRATRGTSKLLLACLHQLPQRFPEALRILILDNATMHQRRAVKRLLPQHDWGVLEHLAPYFPEDNPSERFWQWLQAKVDGATAFDTIDDVINRGRQLVWHDHEGWLTSTSHCNFTDAQGI